MSAWTKIFSWFGKNNLKPPKIEAYSPTIYNTWNKQQLIDRILLLEKKNATNGIKALPSILFNDNNNNNNNNLISLKEKEKEKRKFDMSKYPQHRVAFKVAYLGWNYLGFAAQKETDQTVEAELFKALEKCKLINHPDECGFTRCGRTDKGVSGVGQVISLNVRQHQQKDTHNHHHQQPFPYIETLNSLLPKDIRVHAWAKVSPDFNARFDCISRTYKYMFVKNNDLDLEKMKQAAGYLIGTHDFRNFCKVDPSKQLNYERTILSLDIQPVFATTATKNNNTQCYEITLKGTAFLWHQVRCIMSILFLVGQRLESPDIIKHLLDIDTVIAKPDYPLASDLPLLLYDCEFKGINWQYGKRPYRLEQHWNDLWYDQCVRTWLYDTFLNGLEQQKQQHNNNNNDQISRKKAIAVILGGGRHIRTTKYRPLLTRPRADSEQVKRAKYEAKLQRKKKENSSSLTQ
ncbi:pseudouridine synthase [Cunninghamella echinulata]|nr:pseudouridine synthase [Cunninghamella echinulata]